MPLPQSQVIAEKLPAPTSRASGQPRVIIPSPLVLTEEQERNLIERAKTRLGDLKDELGRAEYEMPGSAGGTSVEALGSNMGKFFARRHLAHLVYQQAMDWRPGILGGLYAESNVHLPITARLVGQQIARANKGIYGTSPYFAVSGMVASDSPEDKLFAADVHAFATHQIDTVSNVAADLQQANTLAFVQGECVVKSRWNKLTSFYESWDEVAVDDQDQPITAQDGDYIRQTDVFEQQQVPLTDAAGQPVLDPQTGQPQVTYSDAMVLKRDGATPRPNPLKFATVVVPKSQALANQVEAKPIYYLDFLCPTSATDVQTADCCVHLYNAQLIELCDRFLREQWQGTPPEEQLQRVAELVSQVGGGSPIEQQALGDREKPENGQTTEGGMTGRDRTEPYVGLAEVWMWCDPIGDGIMRSIMLLMTQSGVPLYYDFAGNLTPNGHRPFHVLRINPVPNSWHGQGNVERLWPLQATIDLLFNRALFAESRAARVDFWDPSCTVEGAQNPDLDLNWGGTYRLATGKKAADALTSQYLTNIKSNNLKDLLQTVLQVAQSMSAVSNVNDAGMAGMDTQKLATGIRNLENSGDELFHQWMSQIRPVHEAILRSCLRLVIDQIIRDPEQKESVVRFFDRSSNRLVELTRADLVGLDLDIKLELTSYRAQAQLTQAQLAYNIVINHLQQPPTIQQRSLPLATQILRALEIQGADKILAPFTPEEQMLMMPPAPAAPGGGVPTPTGEPAQPMI